MVDTRPDSFVFLLVPRFTMIAFASAVEPLRLANQISGQQLYAWRTATEGGGLVRASNGIEVRADGGLDELGRDTTLLLVGGLDVKETITRPS